LAALAAEPDQPSSLRTRPLEPADAVKSFRVQAGFEMQLIAAEPLVTDPVAIEYDEDGRAYVAEMRDYPYLPRPGQKLDQSELIAYTKSKLASYKAPRVVYSKPLASIGSET
jgi:hypothetical protein